MLVHCGMCSSSSVAGFVKCTRLCGALELCFKNKNCRNSPQRRKSSAYCKASARTLDEAATTGALGPESQQRSRSHKTEVVIIGSGLGGLCCAAMLAKYGVKVTVCESHSIPGGAAHAWVQDGYHFESGPSLYSGMAARGRAANPIAHVLQAIDEPLDLLTYNKWNVLLPEGDFMTKVGGSEFEDVLQQVSPSAIPEWRELQRVMKPLAAAATALPPAALRADPAVAVTIARYLPQLLQGGGDIRRLVGPFSDIVDGVVKDKFVRNWLDLLSFLLSGKRLRPNSKKSTSVAFMFNEWYQPNACLEFPRGGSQAIVQALIRGIKKRGGRVMLSAHVDQIILEGGRAKGVSLRGGSRVLASKAVVSNASLWDTQSLLPASAVTPQMLQNAAEIPLNRSFMHLHLGFDARGLEGLEMHHIVVNSWEGGNVVLISIPSVMDADLAPAGKHTLHAYLPATEPFALWSGLERGSPEYEAQKQERSQVLWKAVERIIPDIRQRTEIEMVGTPLTHRHFLRRHNGTYGPAIKAGQGTFPGPTTPIPGLLCCGDSTFPGIGVPAVAASGAIVANTLVPVWDHWKLLDRIGT
ncbi:FAD/NAD(P)-binding domain-containing protein [Coccomyxa subellipsoidea C-169]|uniref:FAD/NAD(P)-binding domain-containing protein n=1 Tax=Coccomyxa subellipsoidea (strain C-169) TaxID=574566 RepID=I0YN64_COCSC|nr:FAD/NAD(P)-binding domain-containing protein [Coccomyxa subellipsoidea C-169]EIE19833.1 FAD/NAD(P)-binding domain-containing protein [Coccomyxa subellipsoidea C-169]|eukprot:XP_005644377.1 FAD/NAD(P)-binding domain-containing protein [Coccomyxa subellipsoidea C-169]